MRLLNGLTDRVERSASVGDLKRELGSIARAMGFKGFAYLAVRLPGMTSKKTEFPPFVTDYPCDWVDHYIGSQFEQRDPVVRAATHCRTPFLWGESTDFHLQTGEDMQVLKEACDFGIRRGFTIPIHGPNAEFGIFTVIGEEASETFDKLVREEGLTIQIIGYRTHAIMVEKMLPEGAVKCANLSEREREVLKWTARGKTSWEISKIVHRSEATINSRLLQACRKLSASNKCHAAAKAIVYGLIDP